MQRTALLLAALFASGAADAVTNLPPVCSTDTAEGKAVSGCATTAQRFTEATPESLVRACDSATCAYAQRTWRRMRNVTPTQFVEVCGADRSPGALDNCQGSTTTQWGAMRLVAATDVAKLNANAAVEASTFPGTFTVSPSTGASPLTVTISWDVALTGGACSASGSWTGTKPLTGSQTVTNLTANAAYTLTCTRTAPASTSARLSWTAPATNTDNSPLTNLAGYRVVWGTSATALVNTVQIPNASATTYEVTGLKPGSYYFAVKAYSSTGAESTNSNVATKTITTGTLETHTATRAVIVTATPNPPTGLTVAEETAYRLNQGWDRLSAQRIGVVPLGTKCDQTQQALALHRVPRAAVKLDPLMARPNVVLAKCSVPQASALAVER